MYLKKKQKQKQKQTNKHKNASAESLLLWISFWAYRCSVNSLYFALDERGNRDFKSVFIFNMLRDIFLMSLAVSFARACPRLLALHNYVYGVLL